MKVLFVDDDPQILEQAKLFLDKENKELNIDTANSGRKALEKLKDGNHEIIVADYRMSEMNGNELLQEFRKMNEEKPFIILTGKGDEKVAMKALNLGANRYLRKKDNPEAQYRELAEIISYEVTHYRMRRKEKFLYSLLRHDVRNKTRIIQEYLERMDESKLEEEQRKYLKKAKEVAKSEVNLIEKIRKTRRIHEEESERVALNSFIEKSIEKNKSKEIGNDCEISYQKHNCKVLGGPLLEDVFSQLIDNSLRHSGCDKVRISSKVSNNNCTVTIEDDGKGIPEDIKDDIFERGWSGRGKRGSGLGLYMIKKILEKYREQITGMVHNTGGGQTKSLGIGENIHYVKEDPFKPDEIFHLIKKESGESWRAMYEDYNMGTGFEIIVKPDIAEDVLKVAEKFELGAKVIGECKKSEEGN